MGKRENLSSVTLGLFLRFKWCFNRNRTWRTPQTDKCAVLMIKATRLTSHNSQSPFKKSKCLHQEQRSFWVSLGIEYMYYWVSHGAKTHSAGSIFISCPKINSKYSLAGCGTLFCFENKYLLFSLMTEWQSSLEN